MNARTPESIISPLVTTVGALLAATALLCGCAQLGQNEDDDRDTKIIVPSTATTTPQYYADGSIPSQRYVVRMSDGSRDWEVEFPEVARGYEVRIPLGDHQRDVHAGHQSLTRADRELIDHLSRSDPAYERPGIYAGEDHTVDREARRQGDDDAGADRRPHDEAGPAPSRPSYLKAINEAQRLFEAGHYEMAMVQISNLEESYPNDVRIQSMKGTLWLRLGRERLARDTWERVLQMDPENEPVREALRRLDGDIEAYEAIDEQSD